MYNLEYKSELRDVGLARAICAEIGAVAIATLEQTDTYFRVPSGRLKRRQTSRPGEPMSTEWVAYFREDTVVPRLSDFVVMSDESARSRYGTLPLPELVTVRKRRELFITGPGVREPHIPGVRIHLDDVEELGRFLEFEALVDPEAGEETENLCSVPAAERALAALRRDFAPVLGEPVGAGYSDLLMAGR